MERLEQVLTFTLLGSVYAIESDIITQILRVPDITPVPLAPPCIRGICPIEGAILTVFDGNLLLSSQEAHVDTRRDSSRIIRIRKNGQDYALLVEEVLGNIDMLNESVEICPQDGGGAVEAILKWRDSIVQMLHVQRLFSGVAMPGFHREPIKELLQEIQKPLVKNIEVTKYLFFMLGGERFAIDSSLVQEIIFPSCEITPVAQADESVMGLITLRGQVIVAVDMSKVLGMEHTADEHSRIIIVYHKNQMLGLLVAAILDIKDMPETRLEVIPERFKKERFAGVFQVEGALISVLDNRFVFGMMEAVRHIRSETSDMHESLRVHASEEQREIVAFLLDGREYGVNIALVDEIIKDVTITAVPYTSTLFLGIINLRGAIIPIISMHARLGLVERPGEDSKIIVCKLGRTQAGFLVDGVSQVMHIDASLFGELHNEDPAIAEVVMLDEGKRIVLVLDLPRIIEQESIHAIQRELHE